MSYIFNILEKKKKKKKKEWKKGYINIVVGRGNGERERVYRWYEDE